MNTESATISEIEEKRILAELELQRMSEKRTRAKQRTANQVVFGLYLAASLFYAGLIYWSRQHTDTRAFILIIASCPFASALIGILARMYRDIRSIRNELEKRNRN